MSMIPAQTMSTSTAGTSQRALEPVYELESNQVSVDTATQQILITPDRSKYNPSETARFVIPTGRANTMLMNSDTYLMLTIKNTGTAAIVPNQTVESIINRLEVLHNESVETRTQYNVHAALKNDLMLTPNKLKLTCGMGASIAANASATFCIPVRSAVCGIDCPKALPLFMMSGADLVLQLTWEQSKNAFSSTAAASYEITSCYLGVSMVQLSAPAANSIKDLFPYAVISTPYIGHSSAIIESGTGFKQVPITARYARATKMEVVLRTTDNSAHTKDVISQRDAPQDLASLQLDVGGINLPTRSVDSITRSAYHTLMCERLHDDPRTKISFNAAGYQAVSDTTSTWSSAANTNPCAYFFCQNFDYIDKVFDTNSLVAGWDLKGVTTNLLLDATLAAQTTMDVFTTNIATLSIRDSILRSWN